MVQLKVPDKFDVIIIDPPWDYSDVGGFTSTNHDFDGNRGSTPYPTMKISEIQNIKLPSKDDCVLFCWTTQKFLPFTFNIIEKWGFKYKGIITWDKGIMGIGRTLRIQTEFCVLAFKGKPIFNGSKTRDIIREKRREHSRKPDSFYQLVETTTIGLKLDYFAREKRGGFFVYGNETGKF